MKRLLFIIYLLLQASTGTLLKAQISPYFHFTEDDGLPGNKVHDIIKDKEGFLFSSALIWFMRLRINRIKKHNEERTKLLVRNSEQ